MSRRMQIPGARPVKNHRSLSSDSDFSLSSSSKLSPVAQLTIEHYLQNLQKSDVTPRSPPQQQLTRTTRDAAPATIIIMGLKRSGKSSVKNVVFHRLPSNETLYLEPTLNPIKDTIHSIMDFDIVDFPANQSNPTLPEVRPYFASLNTVIWVIDAQDEYLTSVDRLITVILEIFPRKRNINFEIFVHKVDGISDDFKADVFRDIQQRVLEDVQEGGAHEVLLNFYQTSVYDHSVFEAFSRVVQKLIPQIPSLENLLNSLCANCGMIKAYLFDKDSKLYLASDTSPGSIDTYEVCSDYIDMVIDINNIYGWDRGQEEDGSLQEYGQATESVISMERRGNQALYLREMTERAILICILGDSTPGDRKTLIDYNVGVFQRALLKVFRR